MLKKLAVGGMIAVMGVLSFGFGAYASVVSSDTVAKTASAVTNTAGQTVASVCDTITSKVDSKISDFNSKFDSHLAYYKNQRGKLQLLVNALNGKGVDTSKLRADLVLYDLKQQKFEDDKAPVLEKIGLIKTDKCANHMISAAGDLTAAISAEKTLLNDDKDLLSFLNTNIQNDITSLRSK